jgi:cytidylate kinase
MKVAVTGRRGGKTTALVQVLKENPNAVMLVQSGAAVRQICREHGLASDRVIQWGDVDRLRGTDAEVVIDNVDMLLQALIGYHKILFTTMTGELVQLVVPEMQLPEGF